jgi:cytoskeleton protein RodZ
MPTIGETLREAREKQKISIDVAAKAVKIKNEVLDGIEKDDFSSFAAPLYARGIIRLYAAFLSLEPETLVEEYNKTYPTSKPKSADLYAPGEREQVMARRRAVVISTVSKPSDLSPRGIIGLVAVVIILGIVIWVLSASRAPTPEVVEPVIAPRMTETQPPVTPTVAAERPPVVSAPAAVVPSLTNEAAPPSPPPAQTNAPAYPSAVPALEVSPDD